MNRFLGFILAMFLVFGTVNLVSADTITINSSAWGRGNYNSWGGGPNFGNTYTGYISGNDYRSVWQFEIPDLSGLTVLSARFDNRFERFYMWDNWDEEYALYDIDSSTIPIISSSVSGANAQTIHNDSGSGTLYGTGVLAHDLAADTLINMALNDQALSDIVSSSGSSFAIGLISTTGGDNIQYDHDGFRWDAYPRTHQLIIETAPVQTDPVPEPATMLLLLVPA